MKSFVSIIIATHNRSHCICNAIDSAIVAFKDCLISPEIIVIDDYSIDKTEFIINERYKFEIAAGAIKYVKLSVNKGVSGARNEGIIRSHAAWVILLDSDDTLMPGSGVKILNELQMHSNSSVIFFRCIDQNGNRVGADFSDLSQSLNLKDFLRYGSKGECLVAIKRKLIAATPFDESLRGYEGLTLARLMRDSGKPAVLSSIIARKYTQNGDDRLSSGSGFIRRIHLIGNGHWQMAKEFCFYMPLSTTISYALKSIAYKAIYFKNNIIYWLMK